jgi:hypothetical protein
MFKKMFGLVFITLTLISPLRADDVLVIIDGKLAKAQAVVDPKPEIKSTGPIELGELVVLAPGLIDTASQFAKTVKYDWEVKKDGVIKNSFKDANSNCVFTTGLKGGTFSVKLKATVGYQIGTDTLYKECMALKDIKVDSPEPTPTPTPKPDPTPPPPAPTPFNPITGPLHVTFIYDTATPDLSMATIHASSTIQESLDVFGGKWHVLTTQSKGLVDFNLKRYVDTIGAPCIVLQKEDGTVLEKQSFKVKTGTTEADLIQLIKNIKDGK